MLSEGAVPLAPSPLSRLAGHTHWLAPLRDPLMLNSVVVTHQPENKTAGSARLKSAISLFAAGIRAGIRTTHIKITAVHNTLPCVRDISRAFDGHLGIVPLGAK